MDGWGTTGGVGFKMIKVKVYAPAFFKLSAMDNDGWVQLSDDASVKTLYKTLNIPLWVRTFSTCYVNHRPAAQSHKLKDNDTVSVFGLVAGG